MKPYGHSRSDIGKSCPYGCCTGKSDKRRNIRAVRDRSRRKRERQSAKSEFKCEETKNENVSSN
jgi:hypothetical protein